MTCETYNGAESHAETERTMWGVNINASRYDEVDAIIATDIVLKMWGRNR